MNSKASIKFTFWEIEKKKNWYLYFKIIFYTILQDKTSNKVLNTFYRLILHIIKTSFKLISNFSKCFSLFLGIPLDS